MTTEMNEDLQQVVQAAIQSSVGTNQHIASTISLSGGCISSVDKVEMTDGSAFVVKWGSTSSDMFAAEARGLEALSKSNSIRVPKVVTCCENEQGADFLIMEFVPTGNRNREFFEVFGRQLASLHSYKSASQFGFDDDNFIGSTPQPNDWNDHWPDFFAEKRIGFQLALAVNLGYADSELKNGCEQLIKNIPGCLTTKESPSLIHGDLWSGNYLSGPNGEPVLIDPATYFASREAEFGMTTLFGGFNSRFYDAYNEASPMNDGWQDRVEIYKLYHLMNHLNLFGHSYLGSCKEILKKYA